MVGSGKIMPTPEAEQRLLAFEELVAKVPGQHQVVVRLGLRDSSSLTIGMSVPSVRAPYLSGLRSAATSTSRLSMPHHCRIVLPFVDAP